MEGGSDGEGTEIVPRLTLPYVRELLAFTRKNVDTLFCCYTKEVFKLETKFRPQAIVRRWKQLFQVIYYRPCGFSENFLLHAALREILQTRLRHVSVHKTKCAIKLFYKALKCGLAIGHVFCWLPLMSTTHICLFFVLLFFIVSTVHWLLSALYFPFCFCWDSLLILNILSHFLIYLIIFSLQIHETIFGRNFKLVGKIYD